MCDHSQIHDASNYDLIFHKVHRFKVRISINESIKHTYFCFSLHVFDFASLPSSPRLLRHLLIRKKSFSPRQGSGTQNNHVHL